MPLPLRLTFVVLLITGWATWSDELAAQQPAAVPVRVAHVEPRRFADEVMALGTLRANESVDLSSNVSEIIETVQFDDGQRVQKGDVLVTMYSTEEDALLNEARATAREAQTQYERARSLAKSGAASVSQLDEARRIADTAKARLAAMESRAKDLVLTAPFAGVIGLRNISAGTLVQPGDLIATLDDDSVMKLDFTVPSTFLSLLTPGAKIAATSAAFPGKTFTGEVSSVSSRIDPVTRSVTVRAMIPNPDRSLRPGLLMSVNLTAHERRSPGVPEGALLPSGRKQFVLVVEESGGGLMAERREVEIGERRDGMVEILSGLESGERVVVEGAFKVPPGAEIRIVE